MPVDVSVVIPAYNADSYLNDCLSGLKSQTLSSGAFEIILVDDGSKDGTLETAKRLKAELDLDNLRIVHQDNAGPAAARNHGIRLAQAPVIAFLDSDCVPQPGWLENLLAPLRLDPALAGVEGRTLPASEKRTLMDHYIDNPNGGFYWTCNIAYRRPMLLAIGGFDEGFPKPAGEDIDIAHRMQQQGKIVFAPDAVVHHLILSRSFMQHLRTARTFSSIIRIYRKHPGLLGKRDNFAQMAFYQIWYLLMPTITQRREFLKYPVTYLKFCLLQVLMALDTFIRLPVYHREATSPLVIREPFQDEAGEQRGAA